MTEPLIRLSDACVRLRAAGVGETDILPTIAYAGLHGRIVATGFQSAWTEGRYAAGSDRAPINRRFWRVLWSPKAAASGFEFSTHGEDLTWTLRKDEEHFQERYTCVLVDRPSFELMLADIAARASVDTMRPHEMAVWIHQHRGQHSGRAWTEFQREHGARAGKRDEFRRIWAQERGNPTRGRRRKMAEQPTIADIRLESIELTVS